MFSGNTAAKAIHEAGKITSFDGKDSASKREHSRRTMVYPFLNIIIYWMSGLDRSFFGAKGRM